MGLNQLSRNFQQIARTQHDHERRLLRLNRPKSTYGVDAREFGITGDGSTDDATALQTAVNQIATAGAGKLIIPPGTVCIGSTITLPAINDGCWIEGTPGEASGTKSGTVFKWTGAASGTMFYMDRTIWHFEGLVFWGNSLLCGVGVHQENNTGTSGTVYAGSAKFTDCEWFECIVGFKNGRVGQNQNGPSSTTFERCKWYANTTGLALMADQGFGITIRNTIASSNTTFLSTNGTLHENGGFWLKGLTIYVPSAGKAFNLPDISGATTIEDVNAEMDTTSIFLNVDPAAGQEDSAIANYTLRNVHVIPSSTTYGSDIIFRQGLNLFCYDCYFTTAITIGNAYSQGTHWPMRYFNGCFMSAALTLEHALNHYYHVIRENERQRLGATGTHTYRHSYSYTAEIIAEEKSRHNVRGQATLSGGTKAVAFQGPDEPDTSYYLVLSGDANETFRWASKTVSGFTINSSNGASTAHVDWTLTR